MHARWLLLCTIFFGASEGSAVIIPVWTFHFSDSVSTVTQNVAYTLREFRLAPMPADFESSMQAWKEDLLAKCEELRQEARDVDAFVAGQYAAIDTLRKNVEQHDQGPHDYQGQLDRLVKSAEDIAETLKRDIRLELTLLVDVSLFSFKKFGSIDLKSIIPGEIMSILKMLPPEP